MIIGALNGLLNFNLPLPLPILVILSGDAKTIFSRGKIMEMGGDATDCGTKFLHGGRMDSMLPKEKSNYRSGTERIESEMLGKGRWLTKFYSIFRR